MTKEDWLRRAKNLHSDCAAQQNSSNGSSKMTQTEAKELNALQHAFGSGHGIHQVTYNEGRTTLDQMFVLVKNGSKDDKLK